MTSLIEGLIYDCLKAQGLDNRRAAAAAAEVLRTSFPDLAAKECLAERDARIYELRASMTEGQLSERFGITTRRVKQIVREQCLAKRHAA